MGVKIGGGVIEHVSLLSLHVKRHKLVEAECMVKMSRKKTQLYYNVTVILFCPLEIEDSFIDHTVKMHLLYWY